MKNKIIEPIPLFVKKMKFVSLEDISKDHPPVVAIEYYQTTMFRTAPFYKSISTISSIYHLNNG